MPGRKCRSHSDLRMRQNGQKGIAMIEPVETVPAVLFDVPPAPVPAMPETWFIVAYDSVSKEWRMPPETGCCPSRESAVREARRLSILWTHAKVFSIGGEVGTYEAEIAELRDFLPDPRALSGWYDPDAPGRVCGSLSRLARLRGIPEAEWPEHIRAAKKSRISG